MEYSEKTKYPPFAKVVVLMIRFRFCKTALVKLINSTSVRFESLYTLYLSGK